MAAPDDSLAFFAAVAKLFPDGYGEDRIPVRALVFYEGTPEGEREMDALREPDFPIARMYLASVIPEGKRSVEITTTFMTGVYALFKHAWLEALSDAPQFRFLKNVHEGVRIGVEWK